MNRSSSLFLLVLVAFLLAATINGYDTSNLECNSEYGSLMGVFDDVPAYSNCNDHLTSMEFHHIDQNGKEVLSAHHGHEDENMEVADVGMKWQCVEYARRYLFLKHNLVFGDVGSAFEIWEFRYLHHPRNEDHRKVHLERRANGVSTHAPQKGDIMIWKQAEPDMPHGHVAIVAGLSEDGTEVYIAEQNFVSKSWEGRHYGRKLKLSFETQESGQAYTVTDPDGPYTVIGWMHPDFEAEAHHQYTHAELPADHNEELPIHMEL